MRIALLAAGSRGDYQPLLAVAKGLQERGHEVGVTATSEFVTAVEGVGVRAEEVAVDLMGYYREHALRRGMPTLLTDQLEMLGEVAQMMAPAVRETLEDLWPRYDAFVTTALSAAWPAVVDDGPRKRQILMMFAAAIPSVWGDISLYSVQEGRSLRNLTAGTRAMGPALRLVTADGSSTVRQKLRGVAQLATVPAFVAGSPQIVTPRRLAGRKVRCTGYPFLDVQDSLPLDLETFLESGPEPVYVGLGSHTMPIVREVLGHTVAAARQLGRRVLVQRGSGLEESEHDHAGDPDVLFVDDAPHELFFPQVAAVVHHGGAGTVAQALRAGRPQLVLPFTIDQPFFGRRVHEIGVGPEPVPFSEATPQRLLPALAAALEPATATRADKVGRAVRQEDGVRGAVAVIEQALARS